MSYTKKEGSFSSNEDLPIRYTFYGQEKNSPLIIFVHGFKGFKDWGAFPRGCAHLADQGFSVLAINLSKNGIDESLTDFNNLELFANQTLTGDLEDVLTTINYVTEYPNEFPNADAQNIGIIGHSRGGHTVIPAAVESDKIKAVVTWSAVANYNKRWSDKMKSDWEKQGYTDILNGRTRQWMRINKIVYDDAMENDARLMAEHRVQELNIPALFFHGKEDPAVDPENAQLLFDLCSSEDKEFILVDKAGHTYETAHPDDPEKPLAEEFQYVLEETTRFFKEYLG
jgi:dienelactone hydrolase